jgi:cell division protein FtsN
MKRKMEKIAKILFFALIIVSFTGCNFFKAPKRVKQLESENASLKMERDNLKKKADNCDDQIAKIKGEYQARLDSLKAGTKKNKTSNVSGKNARYFVVAGSFQNQGYAQNYAGKMAQYNLQVINGAGGWYFVGIGTNDYGEAISLRNTLKGVSVNTWIYQ